MNKKEVFEHWSDWAKNYGTSLRATTKTPTAKLLELEALERRIESIFNDQSGCVLEVGSGNGPNCFHLAKKFENLEIDGMDYVPEMISFANKKLDTQADLKNRLRFFQGDATKIQTHKSLKSAYDLIFTNRCLINLDSTDAQIETISVLASKIKVGGHLIMIENSLTTYEQQNNCRTHLGLEPRTPAEFNLFFQEEKIIENLPNAGLKLVETEDFSSLHDLLLYALVPAINGGTIDYDHPLVHAAAELSAEISKTQINTFGSFGQNRLYLCVKVD